MKRNIIDNNINWEIDDTGLLTIKGSGNMNDWLAGHMPWNYKKSSIERVYIQEGILNIGEFAFCDCINLQAIQIPSSVSAIGVGAFKNCSSIKQIVLPDTVSYIGDEIFQGCINLENIILSQHLSCIPVGAFFGCRNLKNISIPEEVTDIEYGAFFGCDSLTEVVIPAGVKRMDGSFVSCRNIKKVYFSEYVHSFRGAFQRCEKLNTVRFSEETEMIDICSFANCKGLKMIQIPKNVKTIKASAFHGCNNLSDIYYTGSFAEWGSVVIEADNNVLDNVKLYCKESPSEDGFTLVQLGLDEKVNDLFKREEPETENKENTVFVEYYSDINELIPSKSISISDDKTISIKTLQELGFSNDTCYFEGWRINRSNDDTWLLRDKNGRPKWKKLLDNELPAGFTGFVLKKDGGSIKNTSSNGTYRLYAQWGGKEFQVVYHMNEKSEASEKTTLVIYGTITPLIKCSVLGFENNGKKFSGWRLYREIDGKWSTKNEDGKNGWHSLKDGKLPEGYHFRVIRDGANLTRAATSGIVHAYAQWKVIKK